jgi:tartrate dehydrogenase/decarboxylase/D-malate dehydrogenase
MTMHRIAVIAGDGIGTEVMPEGLRVLEAAASRFDINLQFDHFDFSSWAYFERHGKMLPDNWKDQIGGHDAIYFGAVGWPDKVPDHISLWGSLLLFRREFDQYVNLRPARLMPGIVAPVVRRDGSPRQPGEIDMVIVRENTEGEYSSIGGRMFPGTEREIVMQETVMSRVGVDRVLRYAFEVANVAAQKTPDQRHQVKWHCHHHALLGRAGGRNVQAVPRCKGRQVSHRHPDRALCAAPRLL